MFMINNDGKCNTKVSCELYKCKNNMIDCITGNPGDYGKDIQNEAEKNPNY